MGAVAKKKNAELSTDVMDDIMEICWRGCDLRQQRDADTVCSYLAGHVPATQEA